MEFILKKDIPYFSDCEPLVENLGFKLVDLNVFRKQDAWQIKVIITGKNGIGIQECASVHRILQPRLEVLLASQNIAMEVSSPGINRTVKRSSELSAFTGEQAEIWDADISEWRRGILKEVNETSVTLTVGGADIVIPFENIKKARCNL